MAFGLATTYKILIYINKCEIHFELYNLVYPVGINIFLVRYSLFPIGYRLLKAHVAQEPTDPEHLLSQVALAMDAVNCDDAMTRLWPVEEGAVAIHPKKGQQTGQYNQYIGFYLTLIG